MAIASQLGFDLRKEGGGGEWILVIRAWVILGYIGLNRIYRIILGYIGLYKQGVGFPTPISLYFLGRRLNPRIHVKHQ